MSISKANLKPARSGSSVDRIYGQIRKRVMNYEFRPGEPLNETELAATFGVSRTPLREVLNRLVAEGLLDFVPRRGFSGRPLEVQPIFDLYEMRCGLEAVSARLATERASDAQLAELLNFWSTAHSEFATLAPAECVQQDENFHEQIAIFSRNQELLHTLKNINTRIHFIRKIFMEASQRRNDTCDYHQEILTAMQQRNADRAAELMDAHISLRREQLVEVIKEGVVRLYMN